MKEKKEIRARGKLPKIGWRIGKTVSAVFICAVLGLWRGQVPFYSMIAAVICLQQDMASSIKMGRMRAIGTLIGGVFGLMVLLGTRAIQIEMESIGYYFLISLCVIPLIYVTVLGRCTPAASITCIVFFSITVSHMTDPSPFIFVFHRVLDTLIGIGVSLVVNRIGPYRKEDTSSLQNMVQQSEISVELEK